MNAEIHGGERFAIRLAGAIELEYRVSANVIRVLMGDLREADAGLVADVEGVDEVPM